VIDEELWRHRQPHIPIWSSDRMLGRFHDNSTLCTSCHPQACQDTNCHGFCANDVAQGHVGRSCDGCGGQLLDADGRES
jgi:hypothetical protein